jgi:hypothetical protein
MDEIDHKDTIINNWMKCEHTSMKLMSLDKMSNIDGLYHAWRTCTACVIDHIEIQFEG